ncbi:MAG: NAD-dependent epimerase/dehydratase family protein [Actinobacteria bacterium]|nr:NAD-dependent epimerase/dehydratase family protein [Actinomycetota bacterium]MCL5888040.1 NAD-dependent epimerase/dehydratase family protein [Actinomycetota bacterium]
MRVLVTGGAGFIGSHLVDALVEEHDVAVVDDLSTGNRANLSEAARFTELSILDPRFEAVVVDFKTDAIVHLAAQTSVGVSIEDPVADWQLNVEGTRRVALAALAAGTRTVLSASSAAVYGDPTSMPLQEVSHKRPMSPYGKSKLAAEEILAGELADTSVDFASLRFANVYGPRQSSEGEGGVVAIFAAKIAAGDPIVVYGDGHQTRDFIYVKDVVSGILFALASQPVLREGGGAGSAYNISTGTETSVSDMIEIMAVRSATPVQVLYEPPRPGDIRSSYLDSEKARQVFGWSAHIPLAEGIAATLDWYAARRRLEDGREST